MKYLVLLLLMSLLDVSAPKKHDYKFQISMPCFQVITRNCDNKLLNEFKKHGHFRHFSDGSLVGEYTDNFKNYKILLVICKLVYFSIQSELDKSRSMAKFHENCLVFYDSINDKGEVYSLYDVDMPHYDSTHILPKHLKDFLCK